MAEITDGDEDALDVLLRLCRRRVRLPASSRAFPSSPEVSCVSVKLLDKFPLPPCGCACASAPEHKSPSPCVSALLVRLYIARPRPSPSKPALSNPFPLPQSTQVPEPDRIPHRSTRISGEPATLLRRPIPHPSFPEPRAHHGWMRHIPMTLPSSPPFRFPHRSPVSTRARSPSPSRATLLLLPRSSPATEPTTRCASSS